MAQLWFSLAQHSEEQDALFVSKTASTQGKQDSNENGHSEGNGPGENGYKKEH
jgi:hypothetical protein